MSLTAATQPSIEDLVLGSLPGLPRVRLHHPLLDFEVGDDFLRDWHRATRGELGPYILVLEGSVPNEELSGEGYWAALAPIRPRDSRSAPASGSRQAPEL